MPRPNWTWLGLVVALILVAAGGLILRSSFAASWPVPRSDRVSIRQPVVARDYPLRPRPVATTTTVTAAPRPSPTVPARPVQPAVAPTSTSIPTSDHYPAPPVAAPSSGSVWDLVHVCEGTAWTLDGPTYEGGLGFARSTWNAYGSAYAPTAAGASPAQQEAVAERIMPGGPRWPGRYSGSCSGYHGW